MANLRDFGLVTPTGGSNLGDPGQALGGETEMDRQMREAPTYGHTLRNFLTSPSGALGTLGGALASMAASKGKEGAGLEGFLGGLQGGVQQQYQDEVSAYKTRVEAAKTAADAQEKSRSNLVQLLTSRPEMFQDTGLTPEQIGGIVAPGMGVPIDPVTTYKQKTQSAANSDLGKALFDVLKMPGISEDPDASKKVATMLNTTMGLGLPPEVLQKFWEQKGELTDDQILLNFGVGGATEIMNRNLAIQQGDTNYRFKWENLRYIESTEHINATRLGEANKLADKVNAVWKEGIESGHPLPDIETAKKLALSEPEIKMLENLVPTFATGIDPNKYLSTYMQAAQTMGSMLIMSRPGLFKDPQKVLSEWTAQGLSAAQLLQKNSEDKANLTVFLTLLDRVKAEHPDWTYDQQKAEAIKTTKAKGVPYGAKK